MNTQVKHTPGPWKVVLTQYIVPVKPCDSHALARVYRNHPEYEDNAAFIAAAPAMYQSGTLTVDIMERVAKELERKGLEELRSLLRSAIIEQKQALAQAEGR